MHTIRNTPTHTAIHLSLVRRLQKKPKSKDMLPSEMQARAKQQHVLSVLGRDGDSESEEEMERPTKQSTGALPAGGSKEGASQADSKHATGTHKNEASTQQQSAKPSSSAGGQAHVSSSKASSRMQTGTARKQLEPARMTAGTKPPAKTEQHKSGSSTSLKSTLPSKQRLSVPGGQALPSTSTAALLSTQAELAAATQPKTAMPAAGRPGNAGSPSIDALLSAPVLAKPKPTKMIVLDADTMMSIAKQSPSKHKNLSTKKVARPGTTADAGQASPAAKDADSTAKEPTKRKESDSDDVGGAQGAVKRRQSEQQLPTQPQQGQGGLSTKSLAQTKNGGELVQAASGDLYDAKCSTAAPQVDEGDFVIDLEDDNDDDDWGITCSVPAAAPPSAATGAAVLARNASLASTESAQRAGDGSHDKAAAEGAGSANVSKDTSKVGTPPGAAMTMVAPQNVKGKPSVSSGTKLAVDHPTPTATQPARQRLDSASGQSASKARNEPSASLTPTAAHIANAAAVTKAQQPTPPSPDTAVSVIVGTTDRLDAQNRRAKPLDQQQQQSQGSSVAQRVTLARSKSGSGVGGTLTNGVSGQESGLRQVPSEVRDSNAQSTNDGAAVTRSSNFVSRDRQADAGDNSKRVSTCVCVCVCVCVYIYVCMCVCVLRVCVLRVYIYVCV
jgi:hypothetical protein